MIKTVIFDMDGLMFDTERLSNEAFYATADQLGVTIHQEMLDAMKGANRETCNRLQREYFGEDADLEYMRAFRKKYTDKYMEEHGVPEKKGLHGLLRYLKTHGYKVVLATSTPEEIAVKLLKQADVYKYFDHMVFGGSVAKSKPAPDIFLKAAAKAYTEPEKCLVLEDSINGVEAGHAAGCQVIMVPDTIPANDRMREIANDIVESLEDVLEMLSSLEATA